MSHLFDPDVVHATVVADTVETRYLCAGVGPSVLALSDSPMRIAALFRAASRRLRLFAPEPRGAGDAARTMPQAEFDRWLDGFLDALGLLVVYLVTDASFG